MVAIKRAYDAPSRTDGCRILVDRLWPRGVRKDQLGIEKWMRDLGPSSELRKSFGHDPARCREIRRRYLAELKRPEAASLIAELVELARDGPLTLIYSAKDTEHNQAVVLKEFLNSKVNRQQRTHHAREGAWRLDTVS
jgi:uncharacterized protein YeaO (DUF488 family)